MGLFIGMIVFMILSLIRASQVDNWKLENGKHEPRPAPPPVWENFEFLTRYYGGVRTLQPFNESNPEYPRSGEIISLTQQSKHHEADSGEDDESRAQADKRETWIQKRDEVTEEKEDIEEEEEVKEIKGKGDSWEKFTGENNLPDSIPWDKYPGMTSESNIEECFLDPAGTVKAPGIRYYNGRPLGFPQNAVGSYETLGLPEDICFERFGRWGPYGYGYSVRRGGLGTGEHDEREGAALVWEEDGMVDYNLVNWADVQRRCFYKNSARYEALPDRTPDPQGFFIDGDNSTATLAPRKIETTLDGLQDDEDDVEGEDSADDTDTKTAKVKSTKEPAEKLPRTAIVVRCWDEYLFREDDIANIRAMITELSVASGGRYDIHLLVQVKNDANYPIWADHEAYEKRIKDTIPLEFQGLVTLWTETQMLSLYQGIYDYWTRGPDLPVHGAYRGLSMAMQHFAYLHPEYEYYWQWEMDVRYIGHYYDLFTKIENWSKAQPRKGLWERNGRFYLPEVHGSWEDFSHTVRVQTEIGTVGSDNIWKDVPGYRESHPDQKQPKDKFVWGPQRPSDENDWYEPDSDPAPPSSFEKDKNEWGVGEDADYISLSPMFDPEGTTWGLRDDITGFNRSHPLPPRRANIITTSRMSRRLLMTMHKMTAYKKQFAFPEMWPATVALQHGLKAVFAPHPVYVDRRWPLEFFAQTLNAGKDGASGGSRTSVYGDREHNVYGLTWFYNAGFSPNLYRRWLGLKVNNDGGQEFEDVEDTTRSGEGVGGMRGGEGRMCMPPMLLHPIKDVELPVESPETITDQPQEIPEDEAPMDPSA